MDQFFNEDVADHVYGVVSKMSDDAAEMFTRFVTYDVLMQDMENNRRTLSAATERIHKSIAREVSKRYPGTDLEDLVRVISKADGDDHEDTNYFHAHGEPQPRNADGQFSSGKFSSSSITISRTKQQREGEKKPSRFHQGRNANNADFNLTGALRNTGEASNAFSEAWHKQGIDYENSTNARLYSRVQAGSELLGKVPNTKVQAAGQLAGFVGQYGPEAEKVIGPHMRKTAYRYRGTERRPDTKLMAAQRSSVVDVARNLEIPREQISPEERTMASRAAAVGYLNERLPNKRLAALQAASGKIPPSEGVIINADGTIITQAVGFADDHYLPFNLKNLKGLKGGSYVRTRSAGGLTTEDIYTGLLAGARSVTVVSRSGVFTVNFDDDLRGGRRYSDKAAQMVGRYAKTLDAVQSQQVTRKGLEPEERAQIRDEVERQMSPEVFSQAEISAEIKRKEDEYRAQPTLTKAEVEDIQDRARKLAQETGDAQMVTTRGSDGSTRRVRLPGSEEARYKFFRSQLLDDAQEDKARNKWRLDGEGYKVAQEALREQFPYFIADTDAKIRDETEAGRLRSNETDTGYTKPKYNRPEGALEGYYDTSISGSGSAHGGKTGKVSADRTNFQNWSHNPERGAGTVRRDESGNIVPVGGAAAGEAKKLTPQAQKQAKAVARAQQQSKMALEAAVKHYRSITPADNTTLISAGNSPEAFEAIWNNPADLRTLEFQLQSTQDVVRRRGEKDPVLARQAEEGERLIRTYEAAKRQVGGNEYEPGNKTLWGKSPSNAYKFENDKSPFAGAYKPGAEQAMYKAEWGRQSAILTKNHMAIDPATVTDKELKDAADFFGTLAKTADDAKGRDLTDEEGLTLTGALSTFVPNNEHGNALVDANVRRIMTNGNHEQLAKDMAEASEAAERLRRIKMYYAGNGTPETTVETPSGTGTLKQITDGVIQGTVLPPDEPKPQAPRFNPQTTDQLKQWMHGHQTGLVLSGDVEEQDNARALRDMVTALDMDPGSRRDFRVNEAFNKFDPDLQHQYYEHLTRLGFKLRSSGADD